MDESIWKNWEKDGKAEFVHLVQNLLPPNPESSSLLDGPRCSAELKRWVYDLLHKCSKGSLKRDSVIDAIKQLLHMHPDMAGLVVDMISVVEVCLLEEDSNENRERFLQLVKSIVPDVPEALLKERIEFDMLEQVGVVKSSRKLFTSLIKTKTKLYYKQQKFNLFREECEGYSKLITELNQDLGDSSPEDILEVIKSIIGYFNLDPNRVLDIILDSFQCQLDRHSFFIGLLKLYSPDKCTLNELLGFKFKFYLNTDEKKIPDSMFLQTALLIQNDLLHLDNVYGLLGPSDKDIQALADKELSEFSKMRKMSIVSTKGSEEAQEPTATDAQLEDMKRNNKFGLLEALINIGAWQKATYFFQRLPVSYSVSQPNITHALCQLIHTTIEPVYRRYIEVTPRVRSHHYPAIMNAKAIKPVSTLEQFKSTVMPILLILGPYISRDAVLVYKILRIAKASFNAKGTEDVRNTPLYYDVLSLMDEVLLPSLSLSETNCALAEEIWSVLKVYPYNIRYTLYYRWKEVTLLKHPALLRKKATVLVEIKRIILKISKENVKVMSRAIGKITHNSPGHVFEYVLCQIQLYDSLIGPVIDALRYLNSLSNDILGYAILDALSNPDKDRTKHDGTSISLWLQLLSSFCGAVYKKYPIDLTGILQYVANQLIMKKSLDLLILKEMVLKMAGIESAEELTADQIEAMSGGELLRQEAASFNQIKNTKKSSQRLKDCLIDKNLAVPLCLLMAQQRNCVVYQETENSHLKLVGKLFDQCQDTLVQFGNFLASNLSIDDYTRRLPPMSELLTRYHVNSDLAFFLARPMFNHQISLKLDEMYKKDKECHQASANGGNSEHDPHRRYVDAALKVMEPVINAVRPLQSAKTWEDISPQFLTTFWSLTMYDLHVPKAMYEREVSKVKALMAKVDDNKELNASRKKKEKERLSSLMDKLLDEERRQNLHVEQVFARLRAEKDTWFSSRSVKLAKNETITAFLQLCLFPRCVFTSIDAIYCARFVQVIHNLKTPNFSTLICFDRIFCDITYSVASCTENEAHRYGRFLAAMLEISMRWHSARDIFEKECIGYPGFVTKFRVATNDKSIGQGSDDHVDYENYRHVCHKWHFKIAKAMVVCLESKDFVQIRNALTILTKILPFYPVLQKLSGVIEKRIEKVCADEKEQRPDLYTFAISYCGQLKARKNQMMKESEFHLVKNANGESGSMNGSMSASTSASKLPSAMDTSPGKGATSAAGHSASASLSASTQPTDDDKNHKDRSYSARRSQSRESSLSKSDRDKEASLEPKSRKDQTGRDSRSRERQSKERDRHDMGPPHSSTLISHRRSKEPSEERDPKRRKMDQEESGKKEKKKEKESTTLVSASAGNSMTATSPNATSAQNSREFMIKSRKDEASPSSASSTALNPSEKRRKEALSPSSGQPGSASSKQNGDRKDTRSRRDASGKSSRK